MSAAKLKLIAGFLSDENSAPALLDSFGRKGINKPIIVCARSAKVYRNAEWSEFQVKFFRAGVEQIDADYFTDDKTDAMETARLYCERNKGEGVKS